MSEKFCQQDANVTKLSQGKIYADDFYSSLVSLNSCLRRQKGLPHIFFKLIE